MAHYGPQILSYNIILGSPLEMIEHLIEKGVPIDKPFCEDEAYENSPYLIQAVVSGRDWECLELLILKGAHVPEKGVIKALEGSKVYSNVIGAAASHGRADLLGELAQLVDDSELNIWSTTIL